jgi:hypothetical protein
VTVHLFPGFLFDPLAGKQTKQTASFSSTGDCSLSNAMSISFLIKKWINYQKGFKEIQYSLTKFRKT